LNVDGWLNPNFADQYPFFRRLGSHESFAEKFFRNSKNLGMFFNKLDSPRLSSAARVHLGFQDKAGLKKPLRLFKGLIGIFSKGPVENRQAKPFEERLGLVFVKFHKLLLWLPQWFVVF
jgi:hypothetical protein